MEHAARSERDELVIRLLAEIGVWADVGELFCLRSHDLVEQKPEPLPACPRPGAIDRRCRRMR